jgi:hypothetical protein
LNDNQLCVLLQEINRLVLGGDETSATVAEEVAPPAEESTPAPQAESEVAAAGAALPKASVVEGEYSTEAFIFPVE